MCLVRLADMYITVGFMIINTKDLLTVQKFALSAFTRGLYLFDSFSFCIKNCFKKTAKVSHLLCGLRLSNL